jgi:vitamin B12 transporter
MHAAMTRRALMTASCAALIAAASYLLPDRSIADSATPSPSPIPPPATARPSPTPTSKITHYENYLGKIIVRDGPREGYVIPVVALQRLGARTIGDVLRYVPGVVVRQAGTAGSIQTVALRGDSAAQTLILLDGRPVNEGDTGVTDFTSMPLDGVQSISVIEGGFSSRYGSGAIGGVIEIVTKGTSWTPKDTAYAQVGYQGEFGSGIGLGLSNTHGGVVVDAFTRSANNTFDYPSFEAIPGGTRTNNDLHASGVTLCACFNFGGHYVAELHVDDNTSDVGAPGSTEFGSAFVSEFARQQRDVDRNSLNVSYAAGGSKTTAIFYVDGRRLHFYDTTPSFPYDTLTTATQRGFSVMETLAAGYHDTLMAKFEQNGTTALFQGSIYSPAQLVARDSTTDVYIGDDYRGGDGGPLIEAAVQTAHTQGVASTTLPSLAVSQQVGGSSTWYGTSVRASYARSFRAPNLDERYFPGFGNPALQPEYASTFDIGAVTNDRAVDGSATVFGSDTNDLIVNQAIDMMGDFLPFNVGKARVRGFSLQVSNAYNRRVGAQLSYTGYPEAEDLSTAPDINGLVTSGNRLQYRPTATAGLVVWRRAGYDPQPNKAIGEDGFDILLVGRQFADEENKHLLPPYATVGLHISRNLDPHLTVLLRIDNLTGERVPQVYGYPVLGTTFSVRLTAH